MKEITVPSGATVKIGLASFGEAMALKSIIAKELAASPLKIDLNSLTMESDIDLSAIASTILMVDANPAVHAALFSCLARSTYSGEKITQNTFEPEAARGDYYPIVISALEVNLLPFFVGLRSRFSEVMERLQAARTTAKDQKSK